MKNEVVFEFRMRGLNVIKIDIVRVYVLLVVRVGVLLFIRRKEGNIEVFKIN